MTARHITLALGASLLLGMTCSAFAQSTASSSAGSSSMSHGSMSHSMGKSGMSKDASFMRHAAADSLAEIDMGHIALDKSSSAQVKELAQRIIDDHTKANDQLMTIAQQKQVTLPTEPMPMAKQEAAHLKTLSGETFDKAYAHAMVKDHRKAIKLFGMESQNATDSDVKQFASTTLPVLKTHLQMAEQLKGSSSMRGNQGMGEHNSMNHADGTPMNQGTPSSSSSTH